MISLNTEPNTIMQFPVKFESINIFNSNEISEQDKVIFVLYYFRWIYPSFHFASYFFVLCISFLPIPLATTELNIEHENNKAHASHISSHYYLNLVSRSEGKRWRSLQNFKNSKNNRCWMAQHKAEKIKSLLLFIKIKDISLSNSK